MSIEQVLPHLYESGKTPFVLILDGIEDVRNIGGLARSAVWFDVDAIVVSMKKTARINSYAMKASAGALKDIHFCREKTIGEAVTYLKESGLQLIVADGAAESDVSAIKFDEPIALVLGSEGKGVSYALTQMADATISIPGSKRVESLNVSNAGAILMYEIFKNKI
jgi:23S rRNA (guanosine2251-2'-O)-methyltransferase